MGKSKDLATGETRFVNTTGDTMTGDLGINGDLTVDTNALFVDASANKVGINTTTLNNALNVESASYTALGIKRNTGVTTGTGEFAVHMETNSQVSIPYDDEGSVVFGTATAPSTAAGFSEKVRINSAGAVTKPSNPCAAWGSTSGTGLTQNSQWSTPALDYEVFDKGNNYNTTNYRFTAPVAGVYLVGFSGEFTSTANTTWSYLVPSINGSNTANLSNKGNYMADFSHEGTYRAHHQTWFLNLAANDYFIFRHIGSGGNLTLKSASEAQFFAVLLG